MLFFFSSCLFLLNDSDAVMFFVTEYIVLLTVSPLSVCDCGATTTIFLDGNRRCDSEARVFRGFRGFTVASPVFLSERASRRASEIWGGGGGGVPNTLLSASVPGIRLPAGFSASEKRAKKGSKPHETAWKSNEFHGEFSRCISIVFLGCL